MFINAVAWIATAAALVKFALFEWEGILQAWRRATGARKPRARGLKQTSQLS